MAMSICYTQSMQTVKRMSPCHLKRIWWSSHIPDAKHCSLRRAYSSFKDMLLTIPLPIIPLRYQPYSTHASQ